MVYLNGKIHIKANQHNGHRKMLVVVSNLAVKYRRLVPFTVASLGSKMPLKTNIKFAIIYLSLCI